MTEKLQNYIQMAGTTALGLTRNFENWTGFLGTASRLYKYPFTDQILIHAQKPKSTAVAGFDVWTRSMGRYVRRGSRGIGLVRVDNGHPRINYVFDVSDTGGRSGSKSLVLWQYRDECRDDIIKALEGRFGVPGADGLADQLEDVASRLAKDFWDDHRHEIMYELEGSPLEGMDELNVGVRFRDTASASTAYALLSRCGLGAEKRFRLEDFQYLPDFSTKKLIQFLGAAVNGACAQALGEIGRTILSRGSRKESARPAEPSAKPSIREAYGKCGPLIKDILLSDETFRRACMSGDERAAMMEGEAAARRAAGSVPELKFMQVHYAISELHAKMMREAFAETYPLLMLPEGTGQEERQAETGQDEGGVRADGRHPAVERPLQGETPQEAGITADTEETMPEANPTADTEETMPEANPTADANETASEGNIAAITAETEKESNITAAVAESAQEANPAAVAEAPETRNAPSPVNFKIAEDLPAAGPKGRFRQNMEAIAALKRIESENRAATREEQEALSRYAGWGGIPEAFDPEKSEWAREYLELKDALTGEEYASARASVLNAHYTPPAIIRAIYQAVGGMGFQSGNILEPSCGTGSFFGCLPESMDGSKLYGVELDGITGRIAKLLYPLANISVCGYEKTDFPRDFFDLAIGNVPFGDYKVNDPAYDKYGFSIHNYFLAKAIDQLRPGGIAAFATSRYTLDAKDPKARKHLAERADLLGAIRLPNNAFKANAGTNAVADILFLQKRETPQAGMPGWAEAVEAQDGYATNRYFQLHPEMVLGIQATESTRYGEDYTVLPIAGADLGQQLMEAVSRIHGRYRAAVAAELEPEEADGETIPADPAVKNYSYTVVNGKVYYRENSIMIRASLNATAEARVRGMVGLRDCVQRLIDIQMHESGETEIHAAQRELSRLYDAYTKSYGLINSRANRLAFDKDSSYYLLCSLEILDEEGNLERKADMFTKRTIRQHKPAAHADTASEALTISIGERARVDLPFMSELTGKPEAELVSDLPGVIYEDPGSGAWQTADEYLSGNVRHKLRIARAAAAKDPAFEANVKALEAAQPKDLEASEIEVRLGATWIDKIYYQQFMLETLHTPVYLRNAVRVQYSPHTAEWSISNKNSISGSDVAAFTAYGTKRVSAYHILEDSLNLRDVRIYDTVTDEDGKEKRVLNARETTLAAQKQQAVRDAFRAWIWKDPGRRQTLVRLYNDKFNSIRPREYDGSHIAFPGISPAITLQPHQVNAIAHALYGGNTLFAHEVGAGKSFEMIAAAMEGKRLGLCQKSVFVVPNHLTEQMASEFLRLYPAANILVTSKRDFEAARRKKFCARIATSDIDAVIIGHSQFEKIPVSTERQERLLMEQIDSITEGIAEAKASRGERFTIKELERARKGLQAKLERLQASYKKDDVVTFEQLGVDRMFVDEADSYKNRAKRCRTRSA